jgi:hypothetical protein
MIGVMSVAFAATAEASRIAPAASVRFTSIFKPSRGEFGVLRRVQAITKRR